MAWYRPGPICSPHLVTADRIVRAAGNSSSAPRSQAGRRGFARAARDDSSWSTRFVRFTLVVFLRFGGASRAQPFGVFGSRIVVRVGRLRRRALRLGNILQVDPDAIPGGRAPAVG